MASMVWTNLRRIMKLDHVSNMMLQSAAYAYVA